MHKRLIRLRLSTAVAIIAGTAISSFSAGVAAVAGFVFSNMLVVPDTPRYQPRGKAKLEYVRYLSIQERNRL